ncbi:MAG: SDR family oxidoreductase [Elusimicrobia bacterium]|nr:SDR family oxidoreductase [Elusimicrobiota bacterium]
MDPRGRRALVTGGASGIGKAVALRLLRSGAAVALWDLPGDALDAAARELSASGHVRAFPVDLIDPAQIHAAAARTLAEFGEIDILDNNAGVVRGAPFLETQDADDVRTIQVNLQAVTRVTRAFLPGMAKRNSGHLVMMASAAGLLGIPGMAVYAASKHAVIGFAESLRLELRKSGLTGVRVTIVCPSFVNTGMFAGAAPPRLAPWLDPERLADKIIAAIRKDRLYVREPFIVKWIPFLKGMTCTPLLDLVGDMLGMHSAMDTWKGRGPKA